MADWLEAAPAGTKVRMKVRLLSGKAESIEYGPEGPIESVRLATGYKLVALMDESTETQPKKEA
jgi:hypothetical protein